MKLGKYTCKLVTWTIASYTPTKKIIFWISKQTGTHTLLNETLFSIEITVKRG
jgi:hypothetical protein